MSIIYNSSMVYLLEQNIQSLNLTKDDILFLSKYIPHERLEKVRRFNILSDKIQSLISYILLEHTLLTYYGIDIFNIDAISYNKYRKPFLTNYPKIFFNFSHCQNGVCCAISDYGSIGVDFQNIVSISKDAMKEVLTDNEISYIENSHNVNRNFIKLWTLKECYLKYLGTGFFENPKNIEFINDSLNFKKDNLFFKSIFFNDSFISCCSLTECNFKLLNYNDIVSTITNRRCVYDKKVYSGGFWKVGCKDS